MKISVIIPAYNQAESLHLTLLSFASQTCSMSLFEIIVVDDGSDDDTQSVVQSYAAPYHLEYIRQSNQGRSVARNRGVHRAQGEILLFNDCDRAVSNRFVEAHFVRHKKQLNTIVVGSIYEFYFGNLSARHNLLVEDIKRDFSQFSRFAREFPYARAVSQMYDLTGTTNYHIPWISFFSGNVSLPRWAFEQVGGFDESFIGWGFEHFELGFRLCQAGFPFVYESSARNYHFAHRRPPNFYDTQLRSSFEYLKSKHPVQEIILLEDFIKGNLSLQDYEALISGEVQHEGSQPAIYLFNPVSF